MKKLDLTNQIFGYWKVVREAIGEERLKSAGASWICECHCPKCFESASRGKRRVVKVIRASDLRSGRSKSCGRVHRKVR